MNMTTENDRGDFRRQLLFSLGGIGIGLIVAGLMALFINNVVEPTMQSETQELVEFHGDTFSIWYRKDSPYKESRKQLLPRLEQALDELLQRLDVSMDSIPLPIDVLVHDSPEMMQLTTSRRKSVGALYSFYSMVDVLYGEDPYPRLAELVLAFGWGRCSSQLLYKGMLLTVLYPERDFHIPLAAAPARLLHSLDELFLLEQSGAYEETLYQRYQSPFSTRLVLGSLEGIGEFRAMFSDIDEGSTDYSMADLQAASLVQYLVDCGGVSEFRSVWGPGTTEALVSRLACGPLTDLFDDWIAAVKEADVTAPEFPYYRARFLFEAGETGAAARMTESWNPRDLSGAERLLSVRTQLAVGNFEAAARFAKATAPSTSDTLNGWVDVYEGWLLASDGPFTVLKKGTDASVVEALRQVRTAYESAVDALNLRESELPEHITVFFYETDADRDRGKWVIPVVSTHRTLWHISVQDDLFEEFVGTLPSFVVKKDTASNLLRRGLQAALAIARDELIRRGCEMLRAGEWTALWRVGFGGLPDHLFEVQTGLMIRYILDKYGVDVIRDLWVATARIGGGSSLDTALKNVLNTSRSEIEQSLIESVLDCES